MKHSLYITAIFIFAIGLISSCKKGKSDQINNPERTSDIDYNSITDCHLKENPYPSQITAKIEGTWVWEKRACFWTGPETFTADKHVVVNFNDGGLYKVTEDGKLLAEGSWNLAKSDSDYWSIDCSDFNEYIHGRVLLCKDDLVFFTSHVDGCDYYFKRR